jgi:hypothetical protein
MHAKMLAPAAVLVLWSLIMLLWMSQTRFAAFSKAGISLGKVPPGGRGNQLDGKLPDSVMWKSHNYSHLMEQPTIFYPAVLILAAMGASSTDVMFAWAYVALRIAHSLWQAIVNKLPLRFALFFLSTLCLVVLAVRGVMATVLAAS